MRILDESGKFVRRIEMIIRNMEEEEEKKIKDKKRKMYEEEEDWCDKCEKRYIWLEDHMKTEHGIRFSWEQCDDEFRCKERLKEHMEEDHEM